MIESYRQSWFDGLPVQSTGFNRVRPPNLQMAGAPSVLPLVIIAAGLVSVGFIRYLWAYRHVPGGWFFIGTIAAEPLWTLAYGLALSVFDPAIRPWFERPIGHLARPLGNLRLVRSGRLRIQPLGRSWPKVPNLPVAVVGS